MRGYFGHFLLVTPIMLVLAGAVGALNSEVFLGEHDWTEAEMFSPEVTWGDPEMLPRVELKFSFKVFGESSQVWLAVDSDSLSLCVTREREMLCQSQPLPIPTPR